MFQLLGIGTPRGEPPIFHGNPHGDFKASVAELLSKAHDTYGCRADLLIFLQHGSVEITYRVIKNVCDIQFGVASQGMCTCPTCFLASVRLTSEPQ